MGLLPKGETRYRFAEKEGGVPTLACLLGWRSPFPPFPPWDEIKEVGRIACPQGGRL